MTAARNLALEALKACTIYACAGGDGAMKNRHLAAIAALEAETGEPVAPTPWPSLSGNYIFPSPTRDSRLFGNAPAVQPGWKLVPIEPTQEMWKAGLANLFKDVDGVWKAMLEKAPKP